MSSINKVLLTLLVPILLTTQPVQATSLVFTKAQFELIKQQNKGKQWLMILWSVDCPPCFKELAMLKKLSLKNTDLNVVLVNTDASEDALDKRLEIIEEFQLMHLKNFHFATDQGARSRFFIDPSWYGELPRSYFVESNGKFNGISGVFNESRLVNWLE